MKAYQTKTCNECPWRTDVTPGQFPPERFIALAKTAYDMATVQFACHKSAEGRECGCAGFVLAGATHNLGARLAAMNGRLDRDGTEAHAGYREMAVANGVPADHPALEGCR